MYCRGNYTERILTVERVTPTLIICDGTKYSKKDGTKVPRDRWYWSCISVLTPDIEAKYKEKLFRQCLIEQAKDIAWDKLTTKQLQQIIDISKL